MGGVCGTRSAMNVVKPMGVGGEYGKKGIGAHRDSVLVAKEARIMLENMKHDGKASSPKCNINIQHEDEVTVNVANSLSSKTTEVREAIASR